VLGWDEAFLEVDSEWPEEVAAASRPCGSGPAQCSVGIGGNPLRASSPPASPSRPACSADLGELVPGARDRPPDALWGIGAKTAKRLAELGITTVRELAGADVTELANRLGPTLGPWYVRLARGQDRSAVVATPYLARSRSREHTFQRNLTDWSQVQAEVDRLARQVAEDVAAEGRPAVRIVVKVRYAPFTTRTRGAALAEPTGDEAALAAAALAALDRFTPGRPVRLLGVRAEFAASS
jgi:DNA polymerase-4